MYIVYSLLLVCGLVLSLPWWLFQMARSGKYRAGLAERLGFVPERLKNAAQPWSVWVHSVSVGEVLAVTNLVRELEGASPEHRVLISTVTQTGQKLARERFGKDRVFYLPLDLRFSIRSYINAIRPSLLVLAETEFWPNLLHLVKKRGGSVAAVNARISDRSYPRYRRFRWFFARVLAQVDLFLAQTDEDARRLVAIGAPAERVRVSGNLKFDVRPSGAGPLVADLRQALNPASPVIVCGSTAEGEEEMLLRTFQDCLREFPAAVMVMAPRHPERFDEVARLIESHRIPVVRRSAWNPAHSISGCIFLLDSVGELASVYALATVAFVGGSLVATGGHNILEPAQHGVPVLTGPYMFNFREIVRIFAENQALKTVSPDNLSREMQQLLSNPSEQKLLGSRARELFARHSGATGRTLAALQPFLKKEAGRPQ